MKILWLAPFPYPSKSTHPAPWIISLARELVRSADTDITILNYSSGCSREVEVFEHAPAIRVIFVKTPGLLTDIATLAMVRVQRLKRQIEKLGTFDVIHIHGSEHQYEYCISAKDKHAVLSVQGILSEYVHYLKPLQNLKKYITWRIYAAMERQGFRRLHHFSCRTHWDTKIIHASNPGARIHQIWEVIREEFHSSTAAARGADVYYTGGANPLKGLQTAVEAFITFKSKINGAARLVVAGNVKQADKEKLKRRYGSSVFFHDIQFAGIISAPAIVAVQQRSFCHLHPSLIDNSPNSICESQLMGLPVVATPAGGVASLIADGETGLLATGAGEMAAAMIRLFTDDRLWRSISSMSMATAAKRHNTQTIVHDTLCMYRQLNKKG